ncbi:response regulator [Candidatus Saccharibacteria bacterium]|nr:response regulator [Candidatus Saccharibacteria bacterium]
MIFVIEDDLGWESYYRRILKGQKLRFFQDGVAAIDAMDLNDPPKLVILDILLTGPTGFAVLNEMRSYPELMDVPVLIVSSVALPNDVAGKYGVVAALDKGAMKPEDLLEVVKQYA